MRIRLPGREWTECEPATVPYGQSLLDDAEVDPFLLANWKAIDFAVVTRQRNEFRALLRRIDPVYR